jgi:protein EFR3
MVSQVVSAVMENYESPYAHSDNNESTVEDRRIRWVREVLKPESEQPPAVTVLTRVPSWKNIRTAHGELNLTM